jgi:hypothetical protein
MECYKAAPDDSTPTDEITRGFIRIKKEPEKYTCISASLLWEHVM